MQLHRLLLLALLMPALTFGSGLSLRFCPYQGLAEAACCSTHQATNCCPRDEHSPAEPSWGASNRCNDCCVNVQAPAARSDSEPGRFAEHLAQWQVAAVAVIVLPPTAQPALVVSALRPAPPQRWIPIPLRI